MTKELDFKSLAAKSVVMKYRWLYFFYKNDSSSVTLSGTAKNFPTPGLQTPLTSSDVEVSDKIVTGDSVIGLGDSKSLVTFLTEVPSNTGEGVGQQRYLYYVLDWQIQNRTYILDLPNYTWC